MIVKLFLIILLLYFLQVYAYSKPQIYVDFIFATDHPQSKVFENKEQMLKEVEILNKYFVSEKGQKIFDFKFSSFTSYQNFKDKCPSFINYLKSKQRIKHDQVKMMHNQCINKKDGHVYFYIYDAFSDKKGYKDATSWGFNNGSRPFILIDWERLNYNIQAAEPHEMGHAFGLDHVCEEGARFNSSTNIMASSACGKGNGGRRNRGFNEEQQGIIHKYYRKLNKP